jgi:hypothetical protein
LPSDDETSDVLVQSWLGKRVNLDQRLLATAFDLIASEFTISSPLVFRRGGSQERCSPKVSILLSTVVDGEAGVRTQSGGDVSAATTPGTALAPRSQAYGAAQSRGFDSVGMSGWLALCESTSCAFGEGVSVAWVCRAGAWQSRFPDGALVGLLGEWQSQLSALGCPVAARPIVGAALA